MKRIILCILSAALISVLLAGCGSESTEIIIEKLFADLVSIESLNDFVEQFGDHIVDTKEAGDGITYINTDLEQEVCGVTVSLAVAFNESTYAYRYLWYCDTNSYNEVKKITKKVISNVKKELGSPTDESNTENVLLAKWSGPSEKLNYTVSCVSMNNQLTIQLGADY